MPKYYVGSSSLKKVAGGYRGSVASGEFVDVWNNEINTNPELFDTQIVSQHNSRKEALEAELKFQVYHGVVKSEEWINKSLAIPNGFFGMDVSGKNNPMFGKSRRGEKHKGGENISAALKKFYSSEKSKPTKEKRSKKFVENNPSKNLQTMSKIKRKWVENNRNVGTKNGMFGKRSPMRGKKLYNNGTVTKSFIENEQPDGWIIGRHR